MNTYFGVNLKEKRKSLIKSDVARPFLDNLIKKADNALGKEYPCLKFSDFMLYDKTGNRSVYERPYFERRNNLSYLATAYYITQDEKYMESIIDLIFIISDEFTWCLPAHAKILRKNPSVSDIIETVDLFSAETARLFADISIVLNDKLPLHVKERMEIEVCRRVLEPMKKHDFHWKRETNNWASVCAAGVGVALLHYGNSDDKEKILPQIYSSMESFISGFGEDGCCREGYAYWNYGFGYFLLFAKATLYETNGEVDYFKRDIIKKIALYPQNVRVSKDKVVSFSDGSSTFTFSPGAMSCLKEIYADEFNCPDLSLGTLNGNVYSIKEFLWLDENYKADSMKKETLYYPEAQWYIKKRKDFQLCGKGWTQ